MRKILTIAVREYRAMVATKAFAFSILMMPILMFGSLLAMRLLRDVGEIQQRTIVVIDHGGGFVDVLKKEAESHNARMAAAATATDKQDDISFSKGSQFTIVAFENSDFTDEDRLTLSDRVRAQTLYGFVEIPSEVQRLTPSTPWPDRTNEVKFYSEDTGMSEGRRWLSQSLNREILARRLKNAGIDFEQVRIAQAPVPVQSLGLVRRSADGQVAAAEEKDELTTIFVPMIAMFFMFMVTFLASQPMLESVLEEKSQRIAEVLLGSANPTQLMAGKLLGTVAGSLTVFCIYALGGIFLAKSQGYGDLIPFGILPWFIAFQVVGVMFYASIFMAVGASVSQLKEAQSMLLPVWTVMMCPMFVWLHIIQQPNGRMATGLSLFPPATPTMFVLRMATGATLPIWQPIVGLILMILSTTFVVFLAGRIFRVGILWQGKTPKFTELLRWAFSG